MSETTHTPGPWRAEFSESGGYDCMTDAWVIYGSPRVIICDVDLGSYGQSPRTEPTTEDAARAAADARLIAVAPDYHETAADFVTYWERDSGCGMCGGVPHTDSCFVGRFAAVLDKAEGHQP